MKRRTLEVTIAIASAVACSGCERAPPEDLPILAQQERAAALASAARTADIKPHDAPSSVVLTEFVADRPSSLCRPAVARWCALDAVDGAPATATMTLRQGAVVRLSGWAADSVTRTAPRVVVLQLEGPREYYATARRVILRPDVAVLHGATELLHAGYEAYVTFSGVEPGDYAVRIVQVDSVGAASICDARRKLRIEPG